jgi:chemotaxis signal transduction protein
MLGLVFQVGPEKVAVDVRRVHEVVPRVRLAAARGAAPWLAGVFVYHGRVVPVVDLHALTGVGACPPHLSSRIILFPCPANGPDALVGVLAAQVAELREIDTAGAQPIPGSVERPVLGPALADGDGVLRLLSPEAVIELVAAGSAAAPAPEFRQ